MKKKDIVVIILVVGLSAGLSFLLSGFFITSDKNRSEIVEVVEPITSAFEPANQKYFNENSINPTRTITIGTGNNEQPFN